MNKRKIPNQKKNQLKNEQIIEDLKNDDEFLSFHYDPEGKIIFLNTTITPNWLIDQLNNHIISDRNEGEKRWNLKI